MTHEIKGQNVHLWGPEIRLKFEYRTKKCISKQSHKNVVPLTIDLGSSVSFSKVGWQVSRTVNSLSGRHVLSLVGAFSFSQGEVPGRIPISLGFIASII